MRGLPCNYSTARQFALSLATAFLALSTIQPGARADIKAKGDIVVSASPASVSVILGDSVKVPLVGHQSRGAKAVTFRIREQPKSGTLSKIFLDSGDTTRGWVVYRPAPTARPGTDSFTYTAKVEGANASRSVPVQIKLENPIAILKMEPVLPFGQVEIGRSKTQKFKILNRGSRIFSKTIDLPAPWSIPAAQKKVIIPPGDSVTLEFTFSPKDTKPMRHKIELMSLAETQGGILELSGVGASPFSKPFGTLDLGWDAESGKRTGSLRLGNLTGRSLPLKLTAALPLQVESVIVLEPKQALNVEVSVLGIDAFSGKLLIESENHKQSMAISSDATPAKLEVLKPAGREFDFALMDTDTPPVYEIVVINNGGKKAYVYGETSPPFYVVEGADPKGLASGEKMTLAVSMDPREVGSFESPLTILGTANKIEFKLTATVARNVDRTKVGVNLPDLAPLISPGETKRQASVPNYVFWNIGQDNSRRVELDEIPTVTKIYLEEQKRRKLVLSWDHPGDSSLDYILEFEVFEGEDGQMPHPVWYEADEKHIELEKTDTLARITLKKLKPGRRFRIRIRTIDKNGHSSYPTQAESVFTLPPGNRSILLLGLPFLALGGVGYYVWHRRQMV